MNENKVTAADLESIRKRRTPTLVRMIHQLNGAPRQTWPKELLPEEPDHPTRLDIGGSRAWQLMQACWLELGQRFWHQEVKRLKQEGTLQ